MLVQNKPSLPNKLSLSRQATFEARVTYGSFKNSYLSFLNQLCGILILNYMYLKNQDLTIFTFIYRRDVPVGVPLDLSTPTGMSCIGTCMVKIASQTMCQHIVFYLLLFYYYGMKIDVTEKYRKFIISYLFYFLFSEN